MPVIFVPMWATGFICARYTMPYVEPMTLLSLRFAAVAVLLAIFAIATGARWNLSRNQILHLAISGVLLQTVYLGGVFVAVYHGLEAGTSSLIVGLQPILTAALAGLFLRENVTCIQWVGLLLGLFGVGLFVFNKLGAGLGTPFAVIMNFASLCGIAVGAVYQKRFCSGVPLRSANVVQFVAAALACGVLAMAFESREIIWSHELILAFLWLVIVLSLGAVTILYILIKNGAAANVASLFFLVPPCAALMGWILFDERLGSLEFTGMTLACIAVALVNRAESAK